jgi:phosphohistidine phosphatase SixA
MSLEGMDSRRRALLALCAAAFVPRASADDGSLWRALRQGGCVLLIRHAATGPGLGDPAGYRLDDCATQRNLSEAGRDDARRLGERLRAERVPIARAYTSPWCRCRDTAQLAFGKAEDWDPLSSFFDMPEREADLTATVRKRILSYSIRKPGGNVAMVTHNVNIAALTKLSVETSEVVVVKPDGCCALRVAGRLKA